MTQAQLLWLDSAGQIFDSVPRMAPRAPISFGWVRGPVFALVQSERFNYCVLAAIMLNVCMMATEHFDQSPVWHDVQEVCLWLFTLVFTVELVLRLIGLNPLQYLVDPFNFFDMLVVASSWVAILVKLEGSFAGHN